MGGSGTASDLSLLMPRPISPERWRKGHSKESCRSQERNPYDYEASLLQAELAREKAESARRAEALRLREEELLLKERAAEGLKEQARHLEEESSKLRARLVAAEAQHERQLLEMQGRVAALEYARQREVMDCRGRLAAAEALRTRERATAEWERSQMAQVMEASRSQAVSAATADFPAQLASRDAMFQELKAELARSTAELKHQLREKEAEILRVRRDFNDELQEERQRVSKLERHEKMLLEEVQRQRTHADLAAEVQLWASGPSPARTSAELDCSRHSQALRSPSRWSTTAGFDEASLPSASGSVLQTGGAGKAPSFLSAQAHTATAAVSKMRTLEQRLGSLQFSGTASSLESATPREVASQDMSMVVQEPGAARCSEAELELRRQEEQAAAWTMRAQAAATQRAAAAVTRAHRVALARRESTQASQAAQASPTPIPVPTTPEATWHWPLAPACVGAATQTQDVALAATQTEEVVLAEPFETQVASPVHRPLSLTAASPKEVPRSSPCTPNTWHREGSPLSSTVAAVKPEDKRIGEAEEDSPRQRLRRHLYDQPSHLASSPMLHMWGRNGAGQLPSPDSTRSRRRDKFGERGSGSMSLSNAGLTSTASLAVQATESCEQPLQASCSSFASPTSPDRVQLAASSSFALPSSTDRAPREPQPPMASEPDRSERFRMLPPPVQPALGSALNSFVLESPKWEAQSSTIAPLKHRPQISAKAAEAPATPSGRWPSEEVDDTARGPDAGLICSPIQRQGDGEEWRRRAVELEERLRGMLSESIRGMPSSSSTHTPVATLKEKSSHDDLHRLDTMSLRSIELQEFQTKAVEQDTKQHESEMESRLKEVMLERDRLIEVTNELRADMRRMVSSASTFS